MIKAVLDTNFILTCVKQKIDFFNEIEFSGAKIFVPEEVLSEIKKITGTGKKLHQRRNAELALKILEKNKFSRIKLNEKNVDKGLIKISKKDKKTIIATLDKELKRKIKGRKIVIRGKKKIEII